MLVFLCSEWYKLHETLKFLESASVQMFLCWVSICRWKARLWVFLIKFRDDAMFVFLPRGWVRLQRGGQAWKETASAASSTSCLSSTSLSLWVFICQTLTYTSHSIFQSIKRSKWTTHRELNVRNSVVNKGIDVLPFVLRIQSPLECALAGPVTACEYYQDGHQVNRLNPEKLDYWN